MTAMPSAARLFLSAFAAATLLSPSAPPGFGVGVAVVEAYSVGVGTCVVGLADGPAFPPAGNPHYDNGRGPLGGSGDDASDGIYTVEIDGTVLAEGGGAEGAPVPTEVTAGVDHPLVVRYQSPAPVSGGDPSAPIKGFLVTLQSFQDGGTDTDIDVSGSLKLSDADDPDIRILESDGEGSIGGPGAPAVCPSGVSGASHTEATTKGLSSIEGIVFSFPSDVAIGSVVSLTVTVMEGREAGWKFGTFALNVTEGPSAAPTPMMIVTDVPTSSPVDDSGGETSTGAPTSSPLTGGEVTEGPTAAPSAAPLTSCAASSVLAAASVVVALTWLFAW